MDSWLVTLLVTAFVGQWQKVVVHDGGLSVMDCIRGIWTNGSVQ